MSRYILAVPPNDPSRFKEPNQGCWAASLASLLNVTKLGSVGYADIVTQCSAYMNDDGSIPVPGGTPDTGVGTPGGMSAVCALYNVLCSTIPCSNFTFAYASNILQTKGHALIMYATDGDLGHVQVMYGVGVPDDSSISIFDPWNQAPDYSNIPVATVAGSGSEMYIAWAAWAGP
jgi:hypothetical protein